MIFDPALNEKLNQIGLEARERLVTLAIEDTCGDMRFDLEWPEGSPLGDAKVNVKWTKDFVEQDFIGCLEKRVTEFQFFEKQL